MEKGKRERNVHGELTTPSAILGKNTLNQLFYEFLLSLSN